MGIQTGDHLYVLKKIEMLNACLQRSSLTGRQFEWSLLTKLLLMKLFQTGGAFSVMQSPLWTSPNIAHMSVLSPPAHASTRIWVTASPAQPSPAFCSSAGRPAHCLSSSPAQPRTTQLHQLMLSTLSICSPVWGGKSASYHPLNKRQKTRNKRQGIKD